MDEDADRNRSISRRTASDEIRRSLRALLLRGEALDEKLKAWGGPGAARLLKLVRAEVSFLNRAASALSPDASLSSMLRSSNFGHLEDVLRVLQHPEVCGVSAVMQNLTVECPGPSASCGSHDAVLNETAHVDIACSLNGRPVWLIISSRNPRYVRWTSDSGKKVRALRSRLLCLLHVAVADAVKRPESILLYFVGQVPEDVDRGLMEEFSARRVPCIGRQSHDRSGATQNSSEHSLFPNGEDRQILEFKFAELEEREWLNVDVSKDFTCNDGWKAYEVRVAYFEERSRAGGKTGEPDRNAMTSSRDIEGGSEYGHEIGMKVGTSLQEGAAPDQQAGLLRSISSGQQIQDDAEEAVGQRLVSLDTTALVALTAEVSNGAAAYLLALPEGSLEKRFPSMSAFICEQALSELENPLVSEMEEVTHGCQLIISQSVCHEFSSIVSDVGGPKEKETARKLLQNVRVVPDVPSARVMALPLSRKIKERHKIVFGTADFLKAPTLTANMAFVRAARDRGLSLSILEHRPRALIGD